MLLIKSMRIIHSACLHNVPNISLECKLRKNRGITLKSSQAPLSLNLNILWRDNGGPSSQFSWISSIRIIRDAGKYLSWPWNSGHLVNDYYWQSVLKEPSRCYCYLLSLIRRRGGLLDCLSFGELSIPRKNAVCIESVDESLSVDAVNSKLRRRSSVSSLCSASTSTEEGEGASKPVAIGGSADDLVVPRLFCWRFILLLFRMLETISQREEC